MSTSIDPTVLVETYLPGPGDRSFSLLGEGLDNLAYEVDHEFILRVSKHAPSAQRTEELRREASLLLLLPTISSLPTPELVSVDADAGVLVYAKVPGEPLLRRRLRHTDRLAPQFGEFLSRLHRVPPATVRDVAPHDVEPLSTWRDEAEADFGAVATLVPADKRSEVETFLGRDVPASAPTTAFCHADLGAEHILVDPPSGRVSGIIDWTDAALTDPARDLAKIYRDLGPAALHDTVSHYDGLVDRDTEARVVFFARCGLLEDLRFGQDTGQASYVSSALRSLSWVF